MRTDRLLLSSSAALVLAFVYAPAALLNGNHAVVRDEAALPGVVGRGVVEFWQTGGSEFPALLKDLVDYWCQWHAIKVVISSLLVLNLALLAAGLWRRYLDGVAGRAVGAVVASVFTVLATGVLILNIQATAVPLVALLPLLPDEAARTLTGPASSSALPVLVGEVERYHWVMVAVAGTVMLAAGAAAGSLWKRRLSDDPRVKFTRRALSVISALTASLLLAVVAFSLLSALEPTDAFQALIGVG